MIFSHLRVFKLEKKTRRHAKLDSFIRLLSRTVPNFDYDVKEFNSTVVCFIVLFLFL